MTVKRLTETVVRLFVLVVVAGAALIGFGLAVTSSPAAAAITYQGPLTINSQGTYTGNFRGTATAPAIYINTDQPVTIQNCNVTGPTDSDGAALIQGAWHKAINVTIRNCSGYGYDSGVSGSSPARFFSTGSPFAAVHILNNDLEGTGGMYVGGDSTATNSIVDIQHNKARNIDGRVSGGVQCAGTKFWYCHRNFISVRNLSSDPNIEVAWNEIINTPGQSAMEDVVLVQGSSGTPLTVPSDSNSKGPLRIHDNYIGGAYDHRPSDTNYNYTGSGINAADPTTDVAHTPNYVWVYGNQVVNFDNYGIGVWSGHDNRVFDNRVISSNRLPDDSQMNNTYVGLVVKDLWSIGSSRMYNNQVTNNTVGDTWSHSWGSSTNNCISDSSSGYCASVFTGNSDLNNANTHKLVTTTDEANELSSWQQKLATSGTHIGPQTAPEPPTSLGSSAGNGTATLTWSLAPDGGSAITSYLVEGANATTSQRTWSPVTATVRSASGTTGSADISNLTNGIPYVFRLSAVNAIGSSLPSTESAQPVTPVGPPGAPTGVQATAGDSAATITWGAPADNGGISLLPYLVEVSADSGQTWSAGAQPTTESAYVSGLTNGALYVFRVTARNTAGVSASVNSNSVTPVAPLPVPTATVTAAGDVVAAKAQLRGSANPNGAPAKVSFLFGTDPNLVGGTTITASSPDVDGSVVKPETGQVSKLTPGVRYYYQLLISNAQHASASPIGSFTTPKLSTVTIGSVSGVGALSATAHASVSGNGQDATAVTFTVSTDPTFQSGSVVVAAVEPPTTKTAAKDFSASLQGLAVNTRYYLMATATNTYGAVTSSITSFTTLPR